MAITVLGTGISTGLDPTALSLTTPYAAGDVLVAALIARNSNTAPDWTGAQYTIVLGGTGDTLTFSAISTAASTSPDLDYNEAETQQVWASTALTAAQAAGLNSSNSYSAGLTPTTGDQQNQSYSLWLRGYTSYTATTQSTHRSTTVLQPTTLSSGSGTGRSPGATNIDLTEAMVWGGDSGGGNWTSASATLVEDGTDYIENGRIVSVVAKQMENGAYAIGPQTNLTVSWTATVGGANDYLKGILWYDWRLTGSGTPPSEPTVNPNYLRRRFTRNELPYDLRTIRLGGE